MQDLWAKGPPKTGKTTDKNRREGRESDHAVGPALKKTISANLTASHQRCALVPKNRIYIALKTIFSLSPSQKYMQLL